MKTANIANISSHAFYWGIILLMCFMSGCSGSPVGSVSGVVQLEGETNHEAVQVFLPGTQFRAMTDQNGSFLITGIPVGTYSLVIDEDGFESYRTTLEIKSGEQNTLGIVDLLKEIPPYGSITGFVTIEGKSIHEDVLILLAGTPHSAVTNTTGLYELEEVPPGTYKLIAIKEDSLPVFQGGIEVIAGEETEVPPIEIKQPSSAPPPEPETPKLGDNIITGMAMLDGEENHAGIRVELEDVPAIHGITNASGHFEINGVDDQLHTLILSCTGYVTETLPDVIPQPATSTRSAGFITLQKEYTPEKIGILQGRVLLEGGTNHANTTVSLRGVSQSVSTNSDGRYMFVGIPSGNYTLVADHPGYATAEKMNVWVETAKVSNVEDIILDKLDLPEKEGTGGLAGVALLEDTADHGGITVALENTSHSVVTGRNGRYQFEDIPYGSYTLIFSKGEYRTEYLEGVLIQVDQVMRLDPVVLSRDVDPPYVIETFPRDGTRQVPVDQFVDVLIRFSKRMDGASVKRSVIIDPPVSFDAAFDRESELSDMDVLHLRLYHNAPMPVQLKQKYEVIITQTAQTPEGMALAEPYRFSFTTDGPLVVRTIPEEGSRGVIFGLEQPLVFETNAPVDPVSFERSIRFRPKADSQPVFQYMPLQNGTRVVVRMILKPNSNYTVTLDRNLRTVDRERFSNVPFTLSLQTGGMSKDPYNDIRSSRNRSRAGRR